MRVYGLDFTSSPTTSKPLTLADCEFDGEVLVLHELRPMIAKSSGRFQLFERWLQTPGPWVAGIDFPFSQPRELIHDLEWPTVWTDLIAHVANLTKRRFEEVLRAYKALKPKGQKELYRATDVQAKSRSPMKLENPPVAKMFFEGATRLRLSNVSVLPVRPLRDETRIVLEAYPAVVARKWIGRKQGYKHDNKNKRNDEMGYARCDIVQAIRGRAKNNCRPSIQERYNLIVKMTDDNADACIDDGSGDQLDSVLCAVQAAWAYLNRNAGYGIPTEVDQLEGWIIDREFVS